MFFGTTVLRSHGAFISAEPKSGDHKPLPPQFNMVSMSGQNVGNTDDLGHYRISGLAPGEYTARATLQTKPADDNTARTICIPIANFGVGPLVVYAPGGFRKADAKPVTLSAGRGSNG